MRDRGGQFCFTGRMAHPGKAPDCASLHPGYERLICEFDVRKNRIVTVAVSALGRDPRCKVEG
jgi:hypothetical protein